MDGPAFFIVISVKNMEKVLLLRLSKSESLLHFKNIYNKYLHTCVSPLFINKW